MRFVMFNMTTLSMTAFFIMSLISRDVIMSQLYIALAVIGAALTLRILSFHN